MKRNIEPPRLLPHVLQAIADLRESGGVTTRRIVDLVRTNASSAVRPRNITVQVRRAIKHGLERGIIKQRSGKYYANFSDPLKHAMTCKKRGGKKRRGGRKKRRRPAHPIYGDITDASSGESMTATDSDFGSRSRSQSDEPADRGRRRKRKGKGRRKRRTSYAKNMSNNQPEEGTSKKIPSGKKDYSEDYGPQDDSERRPECSNPDCLCNSKQEKLKQEPSEGPVKKSRESFRDNYIN